MKPILNLEKLMEDAFNAGQITAKHNSVRADDEVNLLVNEYHKKWRESNNHFTEEESNFYWSGINDGAYALRNKIKEQDTVLNAKFELTFKDYWERFIK